MSIIFFKFKMTTMDTMTKHLLSILCSGLLIAPLTAQIVLGPDPSFGQLGSWEAPLPSGAFNVQIALQPDQKIIQANSTFDGISVTRLLANGIPDPVFGSGGVVEIDPGDGVSNDLNLTTVMPSGNLLMTLNAYGFNGSEDIDLTRFVRLLPDGTPDPSFGQNGIIDHDLSAGELEEYITNGLALPDGKFMGVGYTVNQNDIARSVVLRLNANGSLDNTFGNNGLLLLNPLALLHIAQDVAVLSNGKFMVLGAYLDLQNNVRCYLARLNANGTVDNTFGQNGYVRVTALPGSRFPSALAIAPNDALYLAGGTEDGDIGWVARLLPNGTLDNAFNQSGYRDFSFGAFTDIAKIALQPNGGVLLGGYTADFDGTTFETEARYMVCRLQADGSLDPGFYDAGYLWSATFQDASLDGLLLQDDGKMLISGYESDNDGSLKFVRRFIVGGTSGLRDHPGAAYNALVFPNPASESAYVQFELDAPMRMALQLIAADGRMWNLNTSEAEYAAGPHQVLLNLPPGLPSGMYQLCIRSEAGVSALPLHIRR